jgi:hypothetical protein
VRTIVVTVHVDLRSETAVEMVTLSDSVEAEPGDGMQEVDGRAALDGQAK